VELVSTGDRLGANEEVAGPVWRQEQADEIFDGDSSQFETKSGSLVATRLMVDVYDAQKSDPSDEAPMIWRRQLL